MVTTQNLKEAFCFTAVTNEHLEPGLFHVHIVHNIPANSLLKYCQHFSNYKHGKCLKCFPIQCTPQFPLWSSIHSIYMNVVNGNLN
jgi:hypothetical protein